MKMLYLKGIGWKGFVDGKDSGVYRVGPLARLNAADGMACQGEALKASIIEKAHQAAEKIKVQAEMTAAQERKAAQEKIRAEMAEMIVEAAEKILAEKLTADEHEKLINEYLTKVVLN
ncbi:MAG: hypothetical protein SV487_09555, partial [Thermodesulfobacteriota bacterium]|nr:hypothetical protein [Thermodesulfobacteriota bacterium]